MRTRTPSGGSADIEARWQYDLYPSGERAASVNLDQLASSRFYVPRKGDVVCEYEGASGGTHSASYAQGPGLDSKMTRIAAGGERRHYVGNLVGTVGMTLSNSGEPVAGETILRDSWGIPVAGASTERYGFAQREHDAESSLVYMRHRMYDPGSGRFIQNDPIWSNRVHAHYTYAGNNPISRVDPLGLQDEAAIRAKFEEQYGDQGKVLLKAWEDGTGYKITFDKLWLGAKTRLWLGKELKVDITEGVEQAAENLFAGLIENVDNIHVSQLPTVAQAFGIDDPEFLKDGTGKQTVWTSSTLLEQAIPGVTPGSTLYEFVEYVGEKFKDDGEPSEPSGDTAQAGIIGKAGKAATSAAKAALKASRRQILVANRLRGNAARDSFIVTLRNSGLDVVGKEIYVRTPGGPRYLDIVIRKNGKLYGFEIKSGGAGVEPAQWFKDALLNKTGGGVLATGKRAQQTKPPIDGQVIHGVTTIHVP